MSEIDKILKEIVYLNETDVEYIKNKLIKSFKFFEFNIEFINFVLNIYTFINKSNISYDIKLKIKNILTEVIYEKSIPT